MPIDTNSVNYSRKDLRTELVIRMFTILVKGNEMPDDKETRITITIPASLRKDLKVNAAKNDRSFSGEIVHCLKLGMWGAEKVPPQNARA